MTKISETSEKVAGRSLKLILLLVLAFGYGLVIAALKWNLFPEVPRGFAFATPFAFCLVVWLIWKPVLSKKENHE